MKKTLLLLLMGLFCFSTHSIAQTRAINGKVTDSSTGDPVAGVTITVKESGTMTTTNNAGNYSIQAATGNTLIFTAVGFEQGQLTVAQGNVLNAFLTPSNQEIDEVIVVAYGTADRRTFTGSASTVTASDIQDATSISFESAMLGKVPGVQITTTSGQAGSTPAIRVRGIGSMNASNSPLYVIDGVPTVSGSVGQMGDYLYTSNNVMNTLNPSDIASITILKDAAASSLYGSRAANGVIIIETKKGRIGKPTINLRSSIGFTPEWATDNYEAAGIQEQIDMMYQVYHDYRTAAGWDEARASADAITRLNNRFAVHGYYFEANSGPGLYESVTIRGRTDGVENRDGQYYNWEDRLFRTGMYQTNDLSVNGGTENTRYYSSLAYTQEKNRVVINSYDRLSGRVNLAQKIGDFVEFTTNVSISHNKQEGYNDTRNLGGNYYLQSRNLLWPLYWPTDYKTGEPFTLRYGSYAYNPEYYENEWDSYSNIVRFTANETLDVRLMKGLNLKSIFSYEQNNARDHIYYSANHYNASTVNGSVSEMMTSYSKLVSSTTMNYKANFGVHGIDLLAGFEAERNHTDFMRATGTNLPSSALPTVVTAGERDANAYYWGNAMMSVLSRAEYSYDNRINLSASYRTDGSSRLSPAVRWGNFWSTGASWSLSEEAFLRDVEFINNLRVKASYGVNGTLPSADFGWRNLTSYGSRYMDDAGGALSTLGNENVTWETSYSSNFGLDFSVMDNRLYGTVEYFNRDTRDVLQNVQISRVTGFGSILRNIGNINNRGLEVSLGYDILRSDDWRWSVNANASFVKSTVKKLYRQDDAEESGDILWSDPTGGDARAGYIYREGESMLSFYGYEWAGVNPENGDNVWYVNHPENPNDPDTGDFMFNGRPATNLHTRAHRIILGSALPDAYGGINTDVEYKGLTLGLNFIYKIGGYLYDGAYKDVADDGYYWERIRAQHYYDNRWTVDNPSAPLPRLSGLDLTAAMQNSNRQMHDASFLRLKNINLAYSLPTNVVSRVGVSNARLYFNGTNLLTFSKYKIADPEVNHYGTRGWETPLGKIYTFGVEFSF